MKHYLHKFESEAAFQSAYTGEEYDEPWVSLTVDETAGRHVDYNREPYYDEGFVFDGAQIRVAPSGSTMFDTGEITLKLLHADPELVVMPQQNYYEDMFGDEGYVYAFNTEESPLTEDPRTITVKIVNARSLPNSPYTEDEVELTLDMFHSYSCAGQWNDNTYRVMFDHNYCQGITVDGVEYRPFLLYYEPNE